jgi:hypothetical protein
MELYKEIIEKEVRDSSFYLPIINVLKKSKIPLSITEISQLLMITYGAAKPRLHKLTKWGIVNRLKRGYYTIPDVRNNLTNITKPKGELFFLRGCIRVMGSSNGVGITIYNSKFGENNKGEYCTIASFEDNKLIIRKSNKFSGSKLHFLSSKSVSISISRKLVSESILKLISTKVTSVQIGIYSDEWSISIKEIFSTESKEDGELAEELNKLGEIKKPAKFENLKADIILNYKDKRVPIEITTIKPSEVSRRPQNRMSSIKASQILMRFYYSIKWNSLYKFSTILVIHKDWENEKWIKKEQDFLRQFDCSLLFTDFKGDWAHISALEIKRLIESSLINKTTLLRSS